MSRKLTLDDYVCPGCMKRLTVEAPAVDYGWCEGCEYEAIGPLTIREMLAGKRGVSWGDGYANWNTVDLPRWTRMVARLLAAES